MSKVIRLLNSLAGDVVKFPAKAAPKKTFSLPTPSNSNAKPKPAENYHEPFHSPTAHEKRGRAFHRVETDFIRHAVKWHRSVANEQLKHHKTALKAGKKELAADHLKFHQQHKQTANDIEDGKLRPSFVRGDPSYVGN